MMKGASIHHCRVDKDGNAPMQESAMFFRCLRWSWKKQRRTTCWSVRLHLTLPDVHCTMIHAMTHVPNGIGGYQYSHPPKYQGRMGVPPRHSWPSSSWRALS